MGILIDSSVLIAWERERLDLQSGSVISFRRFENSQNVEMYQQQAAHRIA
jgi:hypothetical protein